MKKKFGMIRMIFDLENWLWKSEFRDLHSQISNQSLICQRPFTGRFEGQVAKKFLKGIYYICTAAQNGQSQFE